MINFDGISSCFYETDDKNKSILSEIFALHWNIIYFSLFVTKKLNV